MFTSHMCWSHEHVDPGLGHCGTPGDVGQLDVSGVWFIDTTDTLRAGTCSGLLFAVASASMPVRTSSVGVTDVDGAVQVDTLRVDLSRKHIAYCWAEFEKHPKKAYL